MAEENTEFRTSDFNWGSTPVSSRKWVKLPKNILAKLANDPLNENANSSLNKSGKHF
ncbi:hypothetical protein [Fischerella sp. PCC 9605]|uniref:hypothetical protein n=1 Tax=Fischerella sp. PCC 9605 TaxID=1173024 RepID=UPI0012DFC7BC|nr:hypothetical protein [Fischerella sp. PCC 9605]